VNARTLGVPDGFGATVDILEACACKASHNSPLDPFGDGGNRLEISIGSNGEAGFDDVDAHFVEQVGDLELLLERHGCARALLAVAQRCVKNQYSIAGVCRLRHW